jgi:excisionase family DNA binding protein
VDAAAEEIVEQLAPSIAPVTPVEWTPSLPEIPVPELDAFIPTLDHPSPPRRAEELLAGLVADERPPQPGVRTPDQRPTTTSSDQRPETYGQRPVRPTAPAETTSAAPSTATVPPGARSVTETTASAAPASPAVVPLLGTEPGSRPSTYPSVTTMALVPAGPAVTTVPPPSPRRAPTKPEGENPPPQPTRVPEGTASGQSTTTAPPATRAELPGIAEIREQWPRYAQRLRQVPTGEVAQNSYKLPFKETRAELIERLLDPPLSLEDTARLLGVCPTTVRRYTNRGLLQHYRTPGNQRRFRLSAVLAFLEEHGEASLLSDD